MYLTTVQYSAVQYYERELVNLYSINKIEIRPIDALVKVFSLNQLGYGSHKVKKAGPTQIQTL